MSSTLRWCSDCRAEQQFEVPPCVDGHGADCPDLACTACGAAVVVGLVDAVVGSADGDGASATSSGRLAFQAA